MVGYKYIYGIGAFAIGLGLFFCISAYFLVSIANIAVPVSLAFATIGSLAFTVANTLKQQEQRLARLERAVSSQQAFTE